MTDERKRIVRTAYDRIASRYAEWSGRIADEARDRMVEAFAAPLADGARILDLGCGSGLPSTRLLARRFRVLGVDASAAQVERARRNVPSAEFLVGDIGEIDIPDASFDGVVALYAISHVPREEHAALFSKVYRWLRPGGSFLATLGATESPDWTGPWLGEEMFFSSFGADDYRAMLRAAGFALRVDEIAVTPEPEGDVAFLWVIATKPAAEVRAGASGDAE